MIKSHHSWKIKKLQENYENAESIIRQREYYNENWLKDYLERERMKTQQEIQRINPHGVKCPVCNSMKVQEISFMDKAGAIMTSGFVSKTSRCQFECKSCGYKF